MIRPDLRSFQGLSCYTANLAAYLDTEWDAAALLASSTRLAVRMDAGTGCLAFSHHAPALDELPDATRLRYAGAWSPVAALPVLAVEVARFGRALVVVDIARLPWSPALGGPSAPHWILVDGHDRDRWHVVDRFSGLLAAGEQRPHDTWLDSTGLCRAMTLPEAWTPEQRLRNSLAFGVPVTVPTDAGALWLRRVAGDLDHGPGGRSGLGEGWLVGDAAALGYLAGYLAERGARAMDHLDDVWAAAGHRVFAYRWRQANGSTAEALERALAQWERLPRLVRLAVESAGRGRPRPSLVRSAFEELLRAEEDLA